MDNIQFNSQKIIFKLKAGLIQMNAVYIEIDEMIISSTKH